MSSHVPEDDDARDQRAAEKASERARLVAHRGLATWGESLVPLGDFRSAVARAGTALTPEQRMAADNALLARSRDASPVEGPYSRIAVCGGIYSNHVALASFIDRARAEGSEALYCLGDLGGFGPSPEKVWPLLVDAEVRVSQGNYEQSLASGREDCNCGYTDPRDNHFARLSYDYTARGCSPEFKTWMGLLPARRRVLVGERELLLVHGSPRRINEFLFDTTTSTAYLERLLDQEGADGILCTHSGLQWHRRLPSGRDLVNVGVLGRPANDGTPRVWYAVLESRATELEVRLVPLDYDYRALAVEMRSEELPPEFVATIESGWWTTCLEILPAKERARGRF